MVNIIFQKVVRVERPNPVIPMTNIYFNEGYSKTNALIY